MISYHLRHLIYFIAVLGNELLCFYKSAVQQDLQKTLSCIIFQQPVDVSLADLKIFGKGIQGKIFPVVLFDIF